MGCHNSYQCNNLIVKFELKTLGLKTVTNILLKTGYVEKEAVNCWIVNKDDMTWAYANFFMIT